MVYVRISDWLCARLLKAALLLLKLQPTDPLVVVVVSAVAVLSDNIASNWLLVNEPTDPVPETATPLTDIDTRSITSASLTVNVPEAVKLASVSWRVAEPPVTVGALALITTAELLAKLFAGSATFKTLPAASSGMIVAPAKVTAVTFRSPLVCPLLTV